VESKYKVGDQFRVSHLRDRFRKGYLQNYSSEEFTLKRVVKKDGLNQFELKDQAGEQLVGKFYAEELQQTS
jgi:hypothetical protein